MAERLKNATTMQIIRIILYFVVITEMLYFGFRGLIDISIVYILIIISLMVYRFKILKENPWISIKSQLNHILIVNGIIADPKIGTSHQLSEPDTVLLGDPINEEVIQVSTNDNQTTIIDLDETISGDSLGRDSQFIDDKVSLVNFNKSTVDDLRLLGFDGILICIFLLKNEDVYVSARSIMRTLDIPKSTLYRNIGKLEISNYIQSKHTLESPNKSFYQLTIDGRYLIYDLYRLIKQ